MSPTATATITPIRTPTEVEQGGAISEAIYRLNLALRYLHGIIHSDGDEDFGPTGGFEMGVLRDQLETIRETLRAAGGAR
jgi:hypothetical protein